MIHASGEDYLKAIWILQAESKNVRSIDIARQMGVSKASVSHAVTALRKGGFLIMDEDYYLHLTEAGQKTAVEIYERHRFFTQRLIAAGIDPETAEREACKMEHTISQESFECIKEAYNLHTKSKD